MEVVNQSDDIASPAAREIREAAAVVPVESEPAPRLIVDAPLPGPLSFGRVVIQYRTENVRMVPVYGAAALGVSPRIGHLHVTVDDATMALAGCKWRAANLKWFFARGTFHTG